MCRVSQSVLIATCKSQQLLPRPVLFSTCPLFSFPQYYYLPARVCEIANTRGLISGDIAASEMPEGELEPSASVDRQAALFTADEAGAATANFVFGDACRKWPIYL